ncbi:MAG: hypothetical protein LUQ37_07700, partial [Methanoregulaceae archaeon]|nr:hypothetical protein [Methanoregulaceae archaeon]
MQRALGVRTRWGGAACASLRVQLLAFGHIPYPGFIVLRDSGIRKGRGCPLPSVHHLPMFDAQAVSADATHSMDYHLLE